MSLYSAVENFSLKQKEEKEKEKIKKQKKRKKKENEKERRKEEQYWRQKGSQRQKNSCPSRTEPTQKNLIGSQIA